MVKNSSSTWAVKMSLFGTASWASIAKARPPKAKMSSSAVAKVRMPIRL